MKLEQLFESGPLERLVSGAIRNTIDSHGPIDKTFISSASKRICSHIRAIIVNDPEDSKEIKNLREVLYKLSEQEKIKKLNNKIKNIKRSIEYLDRTA